MISTNHRSRVFAAVLAVVTGITLLLRVYLAAQDYGSVSAAVSYLTQFFTILTNFLVFLTMIIIATGRNVRQRILVPLVAAIVCVGLIYHMLLAKLWSPQGLSMIADQGVHTAVPLLTFLWWIVFSKISEAKWMDSLLVIVWPLAYVAYALLRAIWSDFYPYPFLNLTELGSARLSLNVIGLSLVFFVLGFVLLLISKCVYRFRK